MAVLLLSFSACSFSLQGPDASRPRNEVPKCDTGKGLIVLDTLVAVGAGVATLAVLGNTSEQSTALIPAAIGGVYAAGALVGNSRVNACRAEMANYETQVGRRPMLPDEPSETAAARPIQPPGGPVPSGAALPTPAAPTPTKPEGMVSAPPAPAPAHGPPPAQGAPALASPSEAAPAAAPAPPPAKTTAAKTMPKSRPAVEDDWSAFWREVAP